MTPMVWHQVQLHTQQGVAWAVGTHRCVVKSGGMVVLMPSAQVVVMSDMQGMPEGKPGVSKIVAAEIKSTLDLRP